MKKRNKNKDDYTNRKGSRVVLVEPVDVLTSIVRLVILK